MYNVTKVNDFEKLLIYFLLFFKYEVRRADRDFP